jgi:hypothetical protein
MIDNEMHEAQGLLNVTEDENAEEWNELTSVSKRKLRQSLPLFAN